jgi:hypothetical protein
MRSERVLENRSHEMARYLISFDEGAMTFPEEELTDVAEAAHAVVQQAMDAGVWVFGGGLDSPEELSVVGTDGTVIDGPYPESKAYIGGFSVIEVPSREEALEWAAKIAGACRCAQDVREFLPDPAVGN